MRQNDDFSSTSSLQKNRLDQERYKAGCHATDRIGASGDFGFLDRLSKFLLNILSLLYSILLELHHVWFLLFLLALWSSSLSLLEDYQIQQPQNSQPPSLALHRILPFNSHPTCPVDELCLDFIAFRCANDHQHTDFRLSPSINDVLSSKEDQDHSIERLLLGFLQIIGHTLELPEQVAVLYHTFIFLRVSRYDLILCVVRNSLPKRDHIRGWWVPSPRRRILEHYLTIATIDLI